MGQSALADFVADAGWDELATVVEGWSAAPGAVPPESVADYRRIDADAEHDGA
jgi:hypothetical protein